MYDKGFLGTMMQNPFDEREYVTVTGYDSVTNTISGKTKKGAKVSRMAADPIKVEASGKPKDDASAFEIENRKQFNNPVKPIVSKTTGVKSASAPGFDPGANMSMPDVPSPTYKSEVAQQSAAEYADYKQGMMMAAGVEFMVDVMNANNAYGTAKGQAAMNIMMSRNQISDALSRGHEAQMDRQSEGRSAGDSALLAMAAQGQDVQGAGVQKIQGSYENMGIYNGMKEEVNSMREALGYELEMNATKYQLKSAEVAKNYAMIGSALTFGAKAYAYS